MRKFPWAILGSLLFLLLLAGLEISLLSRFSILGIRLNLALVGLFFLIFLRRYWAVFLGSFLLGLFYDFLSLKFGPHLLAFLGTSLLVIVFLKKYLFTFHFFSAMIISLIGSLIFNFLFTIFSYLFYQQSFFDYFLSLYQLGEIGLNTLGVIILLALNSLIKLIFPKNVS